MKWNREGRSGHLLFYIPATRDTKSPTKVQSQSKALLTRSHRSDACREFKYPFLPSLFFLLLSPSLSLSFPTLSPHAFFLGSPMQPSVASNLQSYGPCLPNAEITFVYHLTTLKPFIVQPPPP